MIKPGQLLKLNSSHLFLKADQNIWLEDWYKPGIFLCIKEMDMTKEWANVGLVDLAKDMKTSVAKLKWPAAYHAARAALNSHNSAEIEKTFEKATNEFETTGKIKGYKFLCPNGRNYIWISSYALNEFVIDPLL